MAVETEEVGYKKYVIVYTFNTINDQINRSRKDVNYWYISNKCH